MNSYHKIKSYDFQNTLHIYKIVIKCEFSTIIWKKTQFKIKETKLSRQLMQ